MKHIIDKDRICRASVETMYFFIKFEGKYGYDINELKNTLLEIYPLNKICIDKLGKMKLKDNILKSNKEYKEELLKKVDRMIKDGIHPIVEIGNYETPKKIKKDIVIKYRELYNKSEFFYNKLEKEDEKKYFYHILKLIEKMIYQSYRMSIKI